MLFAPGRRVGRRCPIQSGLILVFLSLNVSLGKAPVIASSVLYEKEAVLLIDSAENNGTAGMLGFHDALQINRNNEKDRLRPADVRSFSWHLQWDSNPCFRLERAAS